MKLISSADAMNFLAKAAPRPWVKRLMQSLIQDELLTPYFSSGKITPFALAGSPLAESSNIMTIESEPEREASTKAYLDDSVVAQIVDAQHENDVFGDSIEWGINASPLGVGSDFFRFSNDVDWENGTLKADYFRDMADESAHSFWVGSASWDSIFDPFEVEYDDFRVSFSGMAFSYATIEMLWPSGEVDIKDQVHFVPNAANIGRPRKWDWEGAMASLVVAAQHPDGLPTGPGAQARIEELLAEWFIQVTGNSPATSQIRQRASKIIQSL